MKIHLNRPNPTLASAFTSLLLQSLSLEARSEIWLISPWLKNVRLSLDNLGHFASVLGGHRDSVDLSEMLSLLARRHHLHLVTKPPSELISLRDLLRLAQKLTARDEVMAEEELKGYAVRDAVITEFTTDIELLKQSLLTHADTVNLGLKLNSEGASLHYCNRLHAKLLWTPIGSLVGSANFTNGGLAANDELMVEITEPSDHDALLEVAKGFSERSTLASKFNLTREMYRAEYTASDLKDLQEHPDVKASNLSIFLARIDSLVR